MSFSESVKRELKRKSNYRCCFCEEINFLDVHHIKPQSVGGSDDIDNAVPLCRKCHYAYGNNPDHRKYLKDKRDWWYEKCDIISDTRLFIEEEIQRQLTDFLTAHTGLKYKDEENPIK